MRDTAPPRVVAHRGYSARAPENTLAALEAAFDAGARAVEFDVHTAACGTPVVFHDAMLSRTTNGVGPLKRRTAAQLRTLDAGRWFDPAFAGERIPTLAEALEACRGRADRVFVEVKGFRELEDVDRMVRITRELGMLRPVVFISMNWTLLDRARSQEPALAVGYIVSEADEADEALARAAGDPDALLDYRASLLLEDPALADRTRSGGVPMAVWTVDDVEEAERLTAMGVAEITTNEVERLLAWSAARGLSE